jgi:hypothetical protein
MPMNDIHESKVYTPASNLVSIKSEDSDDEPNEQLPKAASFVHESNSEEPKEPKVDLKVDSDQPSQDFKKCRVIVNARIDDELISLKQEMLTYYADRSKYLRVFEKKLEATKQVCHALHRRLTDEGFHTYLYKRIHSNYSKFPPGYYISIAPFEFDKDEPTSIH